MFRGQGKKPLFSSGISFDKSPEGGEVRALHCYSVLRTSIRLVSQGHRGIGYGAHSRAERSKMVPQA